MIRLQSIFTLAALMFLLLLAGGCANPWKEAFEPNPGLRSAKYPPSTATVAVREVEHERLEQFTQGERERRIASTTAPADRSPEEKLAAKNRLLEALQLPMRGDEAIVLGSSQFVTAEPLKPTTDKKLRDFARKQGADTVVFSTSYLGQAQRMDQVPVTSYSNDTYIRHSFDRNGRRVPVTESVNSSSTTWVPMTVTEDRYAYHAFFIRQANSK
jgi:hypothetical protein